MVRPNSLLTVDIPDTVDNVFEMDEITATLEVVPVANEPPASVVG